MAGVGRTEFRLILLGAVLCLDGTAHALDIVNYYSPKNRERPRRKATQYLILHTTEGPKKGSLKKVHQNGEAHYFVDTGGRIYRIIDRRRVALHTGRSMWNGRTNLDNHAIGIEVVGYHNGSLTAAQYRSIRDLLSDLQKIYRIPDERVLTHSMVAYGRPNRWHRRSHRGRKRCGMLFAKWSVRRSIGLTRKSEFDPDVKAGRLVVADPYLAKVLYSSAREQESYASKFAGAGGNTIAKGRSAWDIAREKYKSASTVYVLPGGKRIRGNEVRDWKKIPAGTKVVFDDSPRGNEAEEVREIGVHGVSAKDIAGDEYGSGSTIYFMPKKGVKCGNELDEADIAKLPAGTKVLVGYTHGGRITAGRSAFDVCGQRWNFASTFYMFPDGSIHAGNVVDENRIPKNTMVFFRK